jgi:uncharacterized protein YlxP (DUF503 family)
MFVAVARITLSIPEAGSLKSKRHVVHKVLDKVKARFNVSAAEVADLDLWQRATLGIAAVANEHAFAQESISKVVKFIEELYVAPVVSWTSEVIPLGGDLFGEDDTSFAMDHVRTLADAEREAEERDLPSPRPPARERGGKQPKGGKKAMTEEERARAIDDLRRRVRDSRRPGSDPDPDDEEP